MFNGLEVRTCSQCISLSYWNEVWKISFLRRSPWLNQPYFDADNQPWHFIEQVFWFQLMFGWVEYELFGEAKAAHVPKAHRLFLFSINVVFYLLSDLHLKCLQRLARPTKWHQSSRSSVFFLWNLGSMETMETTILFVGVGHLWNSWPLDMQIDINRITYILLFATSRVNLEPTPNPGAGFLVKGRTSWGYVSLDSLSLGCFTPQTQWQNGGH